MSGHLVETRRPDENKLDMKPRGPKVLIKIVPTWSQEHMEVALTHIREREDARRKRR